MERPPNLEQAANQLSKDINNAAPVGIGKALFKKKQMSEAEIVRVLKERYFSLFIYCSSRRQAKLLRQEIGDIYEGLPVVYRPIGKIEQA